MGRSYAKTGKLLTKVSSEDAEGRVLASYVPKSQKNGAALLTDLPEFIGDTFRSGDAFVTAATERFRIAASVLKTCTIKYVYMLLCGIV